MNIERSKPASQREQKTLDNNGRKISSSTLVPVGAAVSVIIALLIGYQWLDERLDSQDAQITALHYELQTVKTLTADRWRGSDMKLWAEMFLRLNPDSKDKVPDPWEIIDQRTRDGN